MLELHRLCRDMSEPGSPLRREAEGLIGEIAALLERPSPRTAELLAGWREDFRVIYGEASLSANSRLDPEGLLRSYGLEPGGDTEARMQALVFAIQTYFSLLMKCVLAAALGESAEGEDLIRGGFALRRGIVNYCGGDWFDWPLGEPGFGGILSRLAGQAARYEAASQTAPGARDDVKRIYESLIPDPLRHALGEYYTPDWLAAHILEQALALHGGDAGSLSVTDPTCGSGTFLLQAIARKRQAGCTLAELLATVRGIDLNPLAVLTAKTNYLLAVLDLLGEAREPVTLPIRRADVLALDGGADRADLVIGNPPWVNWEYLPPAYQERSLALWKKYGLVSGKGPELSFLKSDVSDLVTYAAADRLLAQGGLLAFVLRQGVFKSHRNGREFRRFRLPDGTGLGVLRAEDLSGLKVFPGAAASGAALYLRKGEDTVYPVPYILWEKRPDAGRGPIDPHASLARVLTRVTVREQRAMPAGEDPAAPWLTAPAQELGALEGVLGHNAYRARTGVFTGGANAVYWLTVRSAGEGLVTAANLTARAKRQAPPVEAVLEPDFLYPMLKGGGIRRWQTGYDSYLLCPHTVRTKLRPVPWGQLEERCPRTAAYLASFREVLDARRGFAGWERAVQREEFHAVLRVGTYTFAPWKVVWKYIASEFVCAVIGTADDPWLGKKLLLPNEKVMFVATEREEEAYYLCGLLSSTPVARCVKGYMNPTSISAHVLSRLRLPAYDGADPLHREIARLCREGHGQADITPYLREIDRLAAELYRAAGPGR